MASQESWDFANHLSSRLVLWVAIATIGVQLGSVFLVTPLVSVCLSAGIMVTMIIMVIPAVESALKKVR